MRLIPMVQNPPCCACDTKQLDQYPWFVFTITALKDQPRHPRPRTATKILNVKQSGSP